MGWRSTVLTYNTAQRNASAGLIREWGPWIEFISMVRSIQCRVEIWNFRRSRMRQDFLPRRWNRNYATVAPEFARSPSAMMTPRRCLVAVVSEIVAHPLEHLLHIR